MVQLHMAQTNCIYNTDLKSYDSEVEDVCMRYMCYMLPHTGFILWGLLLFNVVTQL